MSAEALPHRRLHTGIVDTVAIVLVVLAIWEALFTYAGDVAINPPLATFRYAAGLLDSATFWPNVAATMLAFAYALLISAMAGVALGLWLGFGASPATWRNRCWWRSTPSRRSRCIRSC